jgi:hypothetical protein
VRATLELSREGVSMAAATGVRPVDVSVPVWGWLVLATTLLMLWAVAFDGGAVSELVGRSSMFLHEVFHDGRHLLGVPCH